MPVYVDDMEAEFGRMVMCHMVADTTEELLQMADRIGVDRKWIQKPGTSHEHFDVCLSKRRHAIKAGAIEISMYDLAKLLRRKENAEKQRYNGSRDSLTRLSQLLRESQGRLRR